MTRRDPPAVAVLSARLARAYPLLSPFSAASLAVELCAIERAQHRHAVRCCNGEDGGYARHKRLADGTAARRCPYCRAEHGAYCPVARVTLSASYAMEHDPDAERKAGERIERRVKAWRDRLQDAADLPPDAGAPMPNLLDDPRGAVLLVQLRGEREAVSV